MVARKVDLQSTVTNADFRPAVKVVKERTAKGVQIGTLWCPFQLQKFDKVSKVVKDTGQGQMSEKKQQDKSLVQVQNDCHKTVFQQHPFVGVKHVNVCDTNIGFAGHKDQVEDVPWPKALQTQIECIIDRRISKKTRRNIYFSYLVKWTGKSEKEAVWMTQTEIERAGYTLASIHNSRDLSYFGGG